MNGIEGRLVRDLRAQAERITPSSVRRLRLPGPPGYQEARCLRRGARRGRPWVTPLSAAAAVAVVITGTFAAAEAIHHPAPRHPVPVAGPDGLPPYYVHVSQDGQGSAVVARTATGAAIFRLRAPLRSFGFADDQGGDCSHYISAAGDGEFVLMAAGPFPRMAPVTRWSLRGKGAPVRLFLLRVTPAGDIGLSPLRLPERLGSSQSLCYALSPDGQRLALTYAPNPSHDETMVVQVITLATGQTRQWSYVNTLRADPVRDLTWVTSRTLAFYVPFNGPDAPTTAAPPGQDTPGTYLLDTTAHGHNLLADSRRLTGELFEVQVATPDGALLIGNHYQEPSGRAVLDEISVRTGKVVRTFGPCIRRCGRGAEAVLWSDLAGDRLVVAESVQNTPWPRPDVIGILKPGGLTPGGAFSLLRPQPRLEGQIPDLAW